LSRCSGASGCPGTLLTYRFAECSSLVIGHMHMKWRYLGPLDHRSEIWILLAFGKNEQVKKVFWTLLLSMAGLVQARVVDPVTAQQYWG